MKLFSRDLDSSRVKSHSWKVKPPLVFRWLFPSTVWRIPVNSKRVFITFDDGPIPEVTPWVVDKLRQYGAKATFFCVGDNVQKHPNVFGLLADSDMAVGNHTFYHSKAWSVSLKEYHKSIDMCTSLVNSNLFRPPHGQLFPWMIPALRRKFSKIIMWDILSMDYDASLTADDVFNNVVTYVKPGSVIVFHDSLKAWPRLENALPRILKSLSDQGYTMDVIK